MQTKLKPEAGPAVIVAEGAVYYQEFHRELEPFQVTEDDWAILDRTGLFEPMKNDE